MIERYLKNVYCEWNFLEKYLFVDNKATFNISHIKDFISSLNLQKVLLNSDINLFIDVDRDSFIVWRENFQKRLHQAAIDGCKIELNNKDSIIKVILDKQKEDSHFHLKCLGNAFVYLSDLKGLNSTHLNSIYLTCENIDLCRKAMNEYGLIAICPENFELLTSQSLDKGAAILKGEHSSWRRILQGKVPVCNSMVLVDNYALNKLEHLEDNIGEIFNTILPLELNDHIDFHLTIVSSLREGDYKNVKNLPAKPRLEAIRSLLEKLRPNLNFKVSLLKCEKDIFHDRTIITNNSLIISGGGFDLFNKGNNASKSTTISIISPYLNHGILWSHTAYSNMIQTLKKMWRNKSPFIADSFPQFYIGDSCNRLIED